jgi:hypothetical protein
VEDETVVTDKHGSNEYEELHLVSYEPEQRLPLVG